MSHMEVHPDLFQTHPAENSFLKMGKEVGRATESTVFIGGMKSLK